MGVVNIGVYREGNIRGMYGEYMLGYKRDILGDI